MKELNIELFQSVFDTAVYGMIVITKAGVIEQFNHAAEELFGYSSEEVKGKPINMLMDTQIAKEHDEYLENYLKTKKGNIIGKGREVTGKRKDGTPVQIQLSVSVAEVNNEPFFFGILYNVEELAAARFKQDLFSAAFKTAIHSIIVIDDQGIIAEFNPSAEKLFGYEAKDVVGKNIKLLMPDPYRDQHDDYLKRHKNTGHSSIIGKGREVTAVKKDGSTTSIFLSVSEANIQNKIFYVGIMNDISELKNIKVEFSSLNRVINQVLEIHEDFMNGLEKSKLFDKILKIILDETDSEFGFIGAILNKPDGTRFLKTFSITNIAWNEETYKFYKEKAPDGLEFTNLDSLFGYTIKTGELVMTNDPANHPNSAGIPEGHPPLQSYLGIPIYATSGLVAMIGIANRAEGYDKAVYNSIKPIVNSISSIVNALNSFAKIEEMASNDGLTQLLNRASFEQKSLAYIARCSKESKKCALLLIDLDLFKQINDTLGHKAGDQLLIAVGHRLIQHTKKTDLVARLGGDEFVILLKDIKEERDVVSIAQRIHDALHQPYMLNGKSVKSGGSIGIAHYPTSGKDLDSLFKNADYALYQSKQSKKVELYGNEAETEHQKKMLIEKALILALDNDEIEINLKPVFCVNEQETQYYMINYYWEMPNLGTISPDHFLPIAKEAGISQTLNIYANEKLKEKFTSLAKAKNALEIEISLNLEVNNLKDYFDYIFELCDYFTQKDIHLLFSIELEVFLKKRSQIDQTWLTRLKENGHHLYLRHLEDNISMIRELQAQNFDGIIIQLSEIGHDPKFLNLLITLAAQFNLNMILEGIDTLKDYNFVKSQKDIFISGNYVANMLVDDDLEEQLNLG